MKSLLNYIVATLVVFSASALTDDYEKDSPLATEIYQPSNIPAKKLTTILKDLYAEEGLFSADHRQLIIRAKPATMNEILSLLLQLDHPARTFSVLISNKKSETGKTIYSTSQRSEHIQRFSVLENSTFTITQQRQSPDTTITHPIWLPVDSLPEELEYLSLNIQSAEQFVYVTIDRQYQENGHLKKSLQKISGPLGQWLALNQFADNITSFGNKTNTRSLSTQHSRNSQLFIKVDIIN